MTDYQELKRLAEAATPGKWSTSGSYVAPAREYRGGTVYVESWRSIALAPDDRDREFIAAANPVAVLALITEVEFLTESRKEARDERNRFGDQLDAAELKIEQLKAEVEALRQDAERFRHIEQSCDSGMSKIYGDNWIEVIDGYIEPGGSDGQAT